MVVFQFQPSQTSTLTRVKDKQRSEVLSSCYIFLFTILHSSTPPPTSHLRLPVYYQLDEKSRLFLGNELSVSFRGRHVWDPPPRITQDTKLRCSPPLGPAPATMVTAFPHSTATAAFPPSPPPSPPCGRFATTTTASTAESIAMDIDTEDNHTIPQQPAGEFVRIQAHSEAARSSFARKTSPCRPLTLDS